jgi:DNA-binding NarL/FixJ family response regulator
MQRLKVLIADDHRLMLKAVRLALEQANDIEIVGEADSGSRVLPLVHRTAPDVVLLDVRMPGMDGLRCLELIRQRHPKTKVLMLSAVEDSEVIAAALQRGALAFVLKTIDPVDLASAIRHAVNGTVIQQVSGHSAKAEEDVAKEIGLTEREMSIVKALGAGLSNKQIARELWLAEQTVKFHLTNVYRKLGVSSRTEAVRFAYANGLVSNPLLDAVGSAR